MCLSSSASRAWMEPVPASSNSIPSSPGKPEEPISCSSVSVSSTARPYLCLAAAHPYTCPSMARPSGEKLIVDNRRARHDYHLSDRVEAGVVLTGTEVKSLRGGEATLRQAYAEVRDGEAWLVGLHVPEYTEGNRANHDPDRPRKLLLHRKEIDRLASSVAEKGFTVVPTRLYFKDGRVKVELALAKGKELRDKRRDIAARDARRQIERELKDARR